MLFQWGLANRKCPVRLLSATTSSVWRTLLTISNTGTGNGLVPTRVRSHVRFVRNPHGLLHFWLVTFQQEWSRGVHCGAVRPANQAKKVAAAPLSKTAAAAAAAKTWFAKHPLNHMLHNRFPWKRSGRRSSMWPPYSLRRNLSAAAYRPCDRSLKAATNHTFCSLKYRFYVGTLVFGALQHICEELSKLPCNNRVLTGSNFSYGSFTWEPRQGGTTRPKSREVS